MKPLIFAFSLRAGLLLLFAIAMVILAGCSGRVSAQCPGGVCKPAQNYQPAIINYQPAKGYCPCGPQCNCGPNCPCLPASSAKATADVTIVYVLPRPAPLVYYFAPSRPTFGIGLKIGGGCPGGICRPHR